MSEEKMGGYEARLTKRAERRQNNQLGYESGYSKGQAEFHPENVELANELLLSIDKQQLTDVLSDYLRKAGVPLENANTAALQEITARPMKNSEETVAFYAAFTNQITLSTTDKDFLKAKEFRSQDQTIPGELFMKMQLFFIHETCHAFSRNRISTKDANNSQALIRTEGGYGIKEGIIRQSARQFGTAKGRSSLFEALNEGVTQRVAEEVFLELARRTGSGGKAERFLKDFINDSAQHLWRYSIYGNQVDSMCEQIATYMGVTKDVVWDAFKRGYFAKPELFAEETTKLFRETFGDNFLDEYSKLSNKTPLGTLGRFDRKAGFSHPEEYAKKWLDHLGIGQSSTVG